MATQKFLGVDGTQVLVDQLKNVTKKICRIQANNLTNGFKTYLDSIGLSYCPEIIILEKAIIDSRGMLNCLPGSPNQVILHCIQANDSTCVATYYTLDCFQANDGTTKVYYYEFQLDNSTIFGDAEFSTGGVAAKKVVELTGSQAPAEITAEEVQALFTA